MLTYYLKMEPQLFQSALEEQLQKMDNEVNAERLAEETDQLVTDKKDDQTLDLTLSRHPSPYSSV